jgi:hypothetical protein
VGTNDVRDQDHSDVPASRHVGSPYALFAGLGMGSSVSGTLKDPRGAVVSGATIMLVNPALKSEPFEAA